MAIRWSGYLISHAERLYSMSTGNAVSNAKLILARRAKLPEVFTARDVQRKNWAGLSKALVVVDALDCLVEHRYLSKLSARAGAMGGRPTTRYRWQNSVAQE